MSKSFGAMGKILKQVCTGSNYEQENVLLQETRGQRSIPGHETVAKRDENLRHYSGSMTVTPLLITYIFMELLLPFLNQKYCVLEYEAMKKEMKMILVRNVSVWGYVRVGDAYNTN